MAKDDPPEETRNPMDAGILRRVFSWWTTGAALGAASAVLVIAFRLTPPAFDVARLSVTIIAVALAAKLLVWAGVSGATFGRECCT